MQGNDWKEDAFSWIETTYKFRENSYSTDLLIDFSIGTDIKNSSWRVIDIDQASVSDLLISAFGTAFYFDFIVGADVNRFYWILIYPQPGQPGPGPDLLVERPLREDGLRLLQVHGQCGRPAWSRKVSTLPSLTITQLTHIFSCIRSVAERELKDSLEFEMELARASMPREMRRDSNRMYNPMMIRYIKPLNHLHRVTTHLHRDLEEYAPMVPWLEYINKILTPEILVVKDTERVILDEPGYLKNLTEILKRTPKRTIANYMFFRAASSSLGFFTEAARKVQEDYSQELSGTTSKVGKSEETPPIFLILNLSDSPLEAVCGHCQWDFLLRSRPPLCQEALQGGGEAGDGRDGARHPCGDGRHPEGDPVDGRQDSRACSGETSHDEGIHWIP